MISRAAPADKDEPAASQRAYIHATALAIGETGLLVRGPSGAGKSRLALELLAEASRRGIFGRLVGDDRIAITARGGRLVACGHPAIAGRIESRGEGILATGYEAAIVVRLVIELPGKPVRAPVRLPEVDAKACLCGVELPHLRLEGPGPSQAGIVMDHLLRIGNG